jgi:hypothetical protein
MTQKFPDIKDLKQATHTQIFSVSMEYGHHGAEKQSDMLMKNDVNQY